MLKPFTLIFYKGDSIISKIIKSISDGEYSHVAIVIDEFHLLQLDWKTPISISHLMYNVDSYDVYEFKFTLTNDEKERILEYMRKRLNTKYDWKFIISRGFNSIFNTPIIHSENKYNCDELIIEAFRSVIGVDLLLGDIKVSPNTLSKSSLLKRCE